ncbi:MAG: carboxypeptidase regulatory-like domain-containing protein, partial [Rhodothermia bacterium]
MGLLLVLSCAGILLGQTGKIAGRVVDGTGQPLPGSNVLIVGTLLGSVADVDGYYTILNVSPGQHTLRASIIGFGSQVVEGVRVRIDQTTTIDFDLAEEAVGMDEVVITAKPPVVQPDVSNSQMNFSSEEIEMLPVSSVGAVVGLQAGVQGLSIRGGGADEVSFMVNGLTLRDERDNTPYTNISLASVQEVQVQTGGFNAEFGNVRSGIVNVITKEGSRDRYNADVILRYSPPTQKNFGARADDPNSYWMRPFLDPDVAWTGTENGAWDISTQRQYPTFEGWVATSEKLLQDDDPSNDMTPEALQQAFLFQRRKVMEITRPDYNVDVGLGGPVPLVGKALGNMRFYASFRRDEELYVIPLQTNRFEAWTGHLKLTSNITPEMKLTLEGLSGSSSGTARSRAGQPGIFRSASSIASGMSRVSFIDTRIYSTDYWAPTSVKNIMAGAKFTHLLSPSSFYEVRFTAFDAKYDTNPGRPRDETPIQFFGGVGFDEAPFGFQPKPSFGVDGARSGVGMSNARDTSRVTTYQIQADYTSQVNRFLQIKTGLEYNLADTRVNYARFDEFLRSSNTNSQWDKSPARGGLYGQGKIEFKGMIANVGLRLDYSAPGGEWIVYDPYTPAFSAAQSGGIDTLLTTEPIDTQVFLSPRLGVSFPVTEFSKLYFNYGHFRSM